MRPDRRRQRPGHSTRLSEAQNFSKIEERQTIYNTAQYQALLREDGTANFQEAATMQATDPERNFLGVHLCSTGDDGCAGDARLYDWNGTLKKVLFTARSGATISGRVWATKAGPAKRPGIVITPARSRLRSACTGSPPRRSRRRATSC